MASSETALFAESEKTGPTPVDVESKRRTAPAAPASGDNFPVINVVLRFLLLACAVVSVAVMASSKQTELVPIPFPPFQVPVKASFTYSPAFVYFIAALSVAGLYAIISTLLSILTLLNPTSSSKLLAHFVIFDVVLLGIVASATGTAGAVGYLGLKGNSHSRWAKVCNIYDSYCRHVGSAVALSLIASVVLVLLILLNLHSISKKIPK